MQRFFRLFLLAAVLAAFSAFAVACGGDDAAEEDVDTLLTETFSGEKDVKSGVLALDVRIDVEGGQSGVQGPVNVKLGGPFESQGEEELPKFDMDLEFSGGGQSFKAGAASTGDKGFVNWQGTDYAVSDEIFAQFREGYAQAAQKRGEDQEKPSLASLGLDPRQWLTNARNEGESKVGDTDTIKITGGVDVPKLLEDVNEALTKAGELGLQSQAQIPSQLTDEQKRQVEEALKDVTVEIHTGAEDKILRRIVVALDIDAGEDGSGRMNFDMSLTELNEGQDIAEPEDAKPFEELMSQLGGLGGLLGAGAGGSGTGGAAPGDQPDEQAIQEYTQCIEDAGDDVQAAQKCAELIAP